MRFAILTYFSVNIVATLSSKEHCGCWNNSKQKSLNSSVINICGTIFNYTKGNLLHIIFALFLSLTLTQVSDPSIFCVHEFRIIAVTVFVITWLLLPLFLPKQRLVDFFIALLPLHVSLLCNQIFLYYVRSILLPWEFFVYLVVVLIIYILGMYNIHRPTDIRDILHVPKILK